MCSTSRRGATDDVVRGLTGAVRALPPSGRGGAAAAEAEALLDLAEAVNAALLERVAIVDVDGVCQGDVVLTAGAWLRRQSKTSPEAAQRTVRLARRLHTDPDRALPTAAAAFAAGELTSAQAQAVSDVTAAVDPTLVRPIEEALVGHGAHLGADELRRVGKGLVERLVSADAEAPDRRERERGSCYVRLNDTIFGRVAIEGVLSAEVGTLLRALLDPLSAPVASELPDGTRVRDPRPAGERRHDAFAELLAIAAASEATPGQGGSAPHVHVLVDADALMAAMHPDTRHPDGHGDGTGGAGQSGAGHGHRQDGPRSQGSGHANGVGAALSHADPVGQTVDGLRLNVDEVRAIGCDARLSWLVVAGRAGPADDVVGVDAHVLRRALTLVSPALGGLPVEVLAAGRTTRLVTPGQRRALDARDRGCVVAGCDAPARRCHAHHVQHWMDGGPTDLANLVLICPAHHRFLHEHHWRLRRTEWGWSAEPPSRLDLAA